MPFQTHSRMALKDNEERERFLVGRILSSQSHDARSRHLEIIRLEDW